MASTPHGHPSGDRAVTSSGDTDRRVRRFAADASLILAGGRAILLQIADPVVAVGVARHSDFVRRPQRRLLHTMQYVYAVVLGRPSDARAAATFVSHAHRAVPGADDPGHQLWVAATLYESAMRMHELLHGPVDDDLAAAVLRAYEPIGGALRVPAALWPSTPAAFADYWREASTVLRVTDEARGVVRDLLHPRFAPAAIRAAMPLVRIVTVGMLPPALRAAYGLPWGRAEARRFDRTIAALRVVVRVLPGSVRRLPSRVLLWSLRRAAAAHQQH
jgi:uncharacterized protein (DUF2236 family)